LLRTLGASRSRLLQGVVAEFAVLGAIASVLATATASVIAGVLANQVLGLGYQPDPMLWLGAILMGSSGVACAGVVGTWQVIRQPPYQNLQQTGQA